MPVLGLDLVHGEAGFQGPIAAHGEVVEVSMCPGSALARGSLKARQRDRSGGRGLLLTDGQLPVACQRGD